MGTRFQVLFHSPPGVLFTFPSRYWSTIGHRRVLSLGGWSPQIPTGFHVSGGTWDPASGPRRGSRTGLSPCSAAPSSALPLPAGFVTRPRARRPRGMRSRNPHAATPDGFTHAWVWAGPRSLAATCGVSVDFLSSGYLDVSVPPVAPRALCVRARAPGHCPWRVLPFGDPRV